MAEAKVAHPLDCAEVLKLPGVNRRAVLKPDERKNGQVDLYCREGTNSDPKSEFTRITRIFIRVIRVVIRVIRVAEKLCQGV